MTLCIQVTHVFILSTLGLFDFSVVQIPNTDQYKLAETGTSQKHLSKFEAIGLRPFITTTDDEYLPFYMYQEEDGVPKYMKVGDSNNDYQLTVTTNYEERSTFRSKPRDSQGNIYDIVYNNPSNGETWYLQGVFPIVNGTVNHGQAYARVGHRSAHYNISGNIVPLSALVSSNACGQQEDVAPAVFQEC